jgi:hypothetical protein
MLVVDVRNRLLRRLVLVRHQVFRKNVLEVAVHHVLIIAVIITATFRLQLQLLHIALLVAATTLSSAAVASGFTILNCRSTRSRYPRKMLQIYIG